MGRRLQRHIWLENSIKGRYIDRGQGTLPTLGRVNLEG
jgi:hypothetical protein